jgi:TRAP transporter 4TM/12TM fusion protein
MTTEVQEKKEAQQAATATYEIGSRVREPKGFLRVGVGMLGAALTLFTLYTAQFGLLVSNKQRSVVLAFGLALAFLLYPGRFRKDKNVHLLDILFAVGGFVSSIYIVVVFDELALRQGWPTRTDFLMGLITIFFVTIAAIRMTGWILPTICLFFLTYCYWGKWIPGTFGHRGFSITSIVRHMYLSTEGIFGLPLGVVSEFIFLFIFFGVILTKTGVGKFFIDLSLSVMGRARGGPAKVAVIASGLFGTINGSSVANVVGTGTFTIPLMKSIGYRPFFAGATEAAASTGGQLMPPIMGAAAFIMAEFLGVSYLTVALAAALPAVLYYIAVLTSVHIEAVKNNLTGLPEDQIPSLKKILSERGYLMLPVPIIILALVMGYTPTMAAMWSIYISLALPILKKETRYNLKDLYEMLGQGATASVELIGTCAIIGFIIGACSLTGLGLKIAGALAEFSGGHLFPLLFLTMIASLILGTGIPTTGTYIMMALITAPALKLLNVQPIAAHLFVFYYGIISDITPPVALAAMVAAGLAGAPFWKTGVQASKLAAAGFIIPYIFVINPDLLIQIGNLHLFRTALIVITAVAGVIGLSAVVENFFYIELKIFERIPLLAASLLLISPNVLHSAIGFVVMVLIFGIQVRRARLRKVIPALSRQDKSPTPDLR